MSKLRTHLEQSKAEYLNHRYPGDLAAELLPKANLSISKKTDQSIKLVRYLPYISGAIAALVAVAFYNSTHQPKLDNQVVTNNTKVTPSPSPATAQAINTIPLAEKGIAWIRAAEIPTFTPSIPEVDVNANLQVAITKFNDKLEVAMEAPLLSESVDTVKEVAMGFREVATTTWLQVIPQRKPGC